MVLVGDDDGIAGAEVFGEGAGEDVGVLRGRGAEGQLIAFHPEGGGQTVAGFVHLFTAEARGVIGAVGLHLALGVEAGQALDHRAAGVGAARIFEEGLTVEHGLLQGRELLADEVDVKGRQGLGRHGLENSETQELTGRTLAEDLRCAIFPLWVISLVLGVVAPTWPNGQLRAHFRALRRAFNLRCAQNGCAFRARHFPLRSKCQRRAH